MNIENIPDPSLEEVFRIEVRVDKPIVIGQDTAHGRRQLIPILSGKVSGKYFTGKLLPGGVDSQIIRPDGFTELTARYGIMLDDGETVYIDNSGVRRVDPDYAEQVAGGEIVDPVHVYFATVPKFETYSPKYHWMEESIFICYAARLPESVMLKFFRVF